MGLPLAARIIFVVIVFLGDGRGGHRPSLAAASCVSADGSGCRQPGEVISFTCRSIGTFPDPYDCQKFYVCDAVNGKSAAGSCTGSSAYNPLTSDCSLTTSHRVCTEGPIPTCSQVGQMGIVQENAAVYYVCLRKGGKIVPDMFRCPGSMTFDLTVSG
ncbi:uncharacterized protein LOC126259957 [Schistocerca nitens]|uniref:uncharacterized protein LOC126259957 n=1 Tax=Schistocerca nitens TaxID=7011 RepID=UPI002118F476|nr:uncharacterized protein LOC126259957 [Schistocerca nitens]